MTRAFDKNPEHDALACRIMLENGENPVGAGIPANISSAYRSHYLSFATGERVEGGAFRNADVFLKCLIFD